MPNLPNRDMILDVYKSHKVVRQRYNRQKLNTASSAHLASMAEPRLFSHLRSRTARQFAYGAPIHSRSYSSC